jgi:large subunit ribosomal protein L5
MPDSQQDHETPAEQAEEKAEALAVEVGQETVEAVVEPPVQQAEAQEAGATEGQTTRRTREAGTRQGAPRGTRAPRGGSAAATAVVEGPAQDPATDEAVPSPRLREMYRNEIVPTMMREFGVTNPMQVPRLQKIVLNIGLGEALTDSRAMENATRDLAAISGQKPIITKARKSIAAFKLREGNAIGTSVTLRGARMYHFLDRLVNMALPRIRDFRGIGRRGFDGRGNFSLGIREQIIFPEIEYNQIDRIRGLQVTIATTARDDTQAARLLELYGMPFVRQE